MATPEILPPDHEFQTALGFDPGKYNTGWGHYSRIHGLTHTGILDGIDYVDFIPWFHKQVRTLFETFEPDCVCIERFHSRYGGGQKSYFELVNLGIGIITTLCLERGIPHKLVIPATHKSWIARDYEVQKRPVKTRGRGKVKKKFDITTYSEWQRLKTEHEVDAANCAKYALEKVFDR
jgi:Holliday junction resolvasome RuvABC endonuclease subunit